MKNHHLRKNHLLRRLPKSPDIANYYTYIYVDNRFLMGELLKINLPVHVFQF